MSRVGRMLWVFFLTVAGIFPALFIAPPGALAYCSLVGDDFSTDVGVAVYECDTTEECVEWLELMKEGLDPRYEWEIVCDSYDGEVNVEDNPLGEPPPLERDDPPQVIHLEPACYGESCEGIDPEGTRCLDDAYTIYRADVVINSEGFEESFSWGNAEMRYSPLCHANWVRYTPYTNLDDVIRFLFDVGVRASNDDNGPGGGKGLGYYFGNPYIWRLGVDGTLQGPTGSSDPMNWQVTTWTSMVSADGTTCWSVEIIWVEDHHAGAGERDKVGTFDADCVN